ncbi:unnamed protein product [Camellia sinensis]
MMFTPGARLDLRNIYLDEITVEQIKEAFKEFTTREDVAIVMISQYMLVDDIGDVTITNDGAIILKMLYVEHPAAKVEE